MSTVPPPSTAWSPSRPMSGKRVVITGASGGIGKHTAVGLARLGADLTLVCRDAARGETVAGLARDAGAGDVRVLLADLASQADIRRVATEICAGHDRIDVLLNNAGAIFQQRQTTVDGLEMTFAMNHLGYFLLTVLLRDILVASQPARVVNVSSRAHEDGLIQFADLQSERNYSAMRAYAQSKLANVLFTTELARRLTGTGVTANSLHPGLVATNFGKNNWGWLNLAVRLLRPWMITEEAGALTSIHVASAPELVTVSGCYFAKSVESATSAAGRDAETARRLWDASEVLTTTRSS